MTPAMNVGGDSGVDAGTALALAMVMAMTSAITLAIPPANLDGRVPRASAADPSAGLESLLRTAAAATAPRCAGGRASVCAQRAAHDADRDARICAQRRAGRLGSLASGTASSAPAEWPRNVEAGAHPPRSPRMGADKATKLVQRCAFVTQRRQASGRRLLPRARLSARCDHSGRKVRGRSAASSSQSVTEMVPRGTYSAQMAIVSGQRAKYVQLMTL